MFTDKENSEAQKRVQKGVEMKRTGSMVYKETVESMELFLYTVNDGNLYRNRSTYVIDSLKKKYRKGIYDTDRAIDLWYAVATDAAKKYAGEFGSADFKFSVGDRFTVAIELEKYYREEVQE